MQTNPVASPLNMLTSPPAAKGQRKEDGPTFGQLLSREVADRKETARAQSPREAQADKPAQVKTEQRPAKPSAEKAEKGAAKADRAEAAVEKKVDEEVRVEDAANNLSSEMLALVNSLNITATTPAKAAANGSADLPTSKGRRAEALLGVTDKLTDTLTEMARLSRQAASVDIQGTGLAAERKAELAIALAADAVQGASASAQTDAAFAAELQSALGTAPSSLEPLQPTANVIAQAATAQVTETIAPRAGTPAWDQAIAQGVARMINSDQQTAELTLNPPNLGPLTQPLQQTANVAAQAATAQVTEPIAPRVGTPTWDQAIAQGVVRMVNSDQQTAELMLNPPDLGSLTQPLQQISNVAAQAATAQVTEPIAPRVGTPTWDQAIAQGVVRMVNSDQQTAELMPNPPDLGPLTQPLQQTSNVAAQAATARVTEQIAPRVGTPAWDQAIAQGVVRVVNSDQRTAELTLDPRDIGRLMLPPQQTANVAAQTETSQVTEQIAPRVGTPAWDQAIAQGVVQVVNTDERTAELTLNPPDLGPLIQPPQQTSNVAAQAATAQGTEHIAPRVGTSAWDQAIAQGVVRMVNADQQTAELTLNPPDLGPLKVVLNVSNAQADATFSAAQPEVRQALEAAMPKLRDMLSEAGIQLNQANVNSGAANQNGDAYKQARRSSNGQDGGGDGRSENASIARVQPANVGRGLVDTFA